MEKCYCWEGITVIIAKLSSISVQCMHTTSINQRSSLYTKEGDFPPICCVYHIIPSSWKSNIQNPLEDQNNISTRRRISLHPLCIFCLGRKKEKERKVRFWLSISLFGYSWNAYLVFIISISFSFSNVFYCFYS